MQSTSTVDLIGALAPLRTLEQRLAALEEANRIRSYRAELKRRLRGGNVGAAAALEDPDCDTMKVVDLLLALPTVGRVKANRALTRMRISPSKTIGGLSDRQRVELVAQLPAPRVRS